jgi:RES domain-containing protein
MKLWRLTRAAHVALDGAGARAHGGRYSPVGVPVVSLASEAGLAVLVALRYLPQDRAQWPRDAVLGWTEADATPERAPDGDEEAVRAVGTWLAQRRSLLAAVRSQVLPEADVILLNPLHPAAAGVPPLTTRPSTLPNACTSRRCWSVSPAAEASSAQLSSSSRSASITMRSTGRVTCVTSLTAASATS